MSDLFYMGGALFMGILSLVLIVILAWGIFHFIAGLSSNASNPGLSIRRLAYLKSFGLFAMVTGILGQLIGLYSAFAAIEEAGDISKALFFGGLKVSLITVIYGAIIYLFALILWFVLDYVLNKKQ